MINWLGPRHRRILGVDICSTTVKIIEMDCVGEQITINSYGSAMLPVGAMEGGSIKEVDTVAETIRLIVKRDKISCKKAVLAVPDSLMISRLIQVNEGMREDEIEEVVIMEADKYFPYPIDEINIDFDIQGTSTKNSAMLDVMIVASRAEHVANRVEAVTKAGLIADAVDIESFAIERAVKILKPDLPNEGDNKVIAVIDIGSAYTHFFIMHNMKMVFTREEEFGAKQLVQSAMQRYSMTEEDVEQAIKDNSLPDDFEPEILQPFKELILLHIKRGLQFFFSSSQYSKIDKIILAGGVANIEKIEELVEDNISVPCMAANPFRRVSVPRESVLEAINKEAPSLLVACGLALRVMKEKE